MNLHRFRVLTVAALAVSSIAASANGGTIAPALERALSVAGADEFVPVVVMMEEFPGRRARLAEVRGLSRKDRRAHVVSSMQRLADRSQSRLRAALTAEPGARRVRVLWGVNGMALEAQPDVIERIGLIPGVRRVQYDGGRGGPANGDRGNAGEPAATGPTGGDVSGPNPDASIRSEVVAMGAPDVWAIGYTGAGVIVAVLDTGVDPSHPDLADHIWTNLGEVAGNAIDDDGNGYVDDTWGWDFCDNDNVPISGNHGTQVAGQVAGDGTGGVVTGMAPDAELMVLGFDCSPSDSIGWEASDYAIAMGADIITESFVWPWNLNDMPDYEGWRRQMETELTAGVIHANAAGNDAQNVDRPIPYNVGAPANSPPPWHHPDQTLIGGLSSVIAVGNIAWPGDVIAPSSSLGPSAWEDIIAHSWADYPHSLTPALFDYPYENGLQAGLIRPDVSAYGSGTSTTCVGGGYCGFSGTSSATPHVSGVLALMLQSNPQATPAELSEAIMATAQHRGDPGKNNTYGAGLIQALEAVQAVESSVLYESHVIDDSEFGNGDAMLDPGETVTMSITLASRTDLDVEGIEAILSSTSPGVTIHGQLAIYPSLPARGTAHSVAPHFSITVDPSACSSFITFDLEVRYGGSVRRSSFDIRVGEPESITQLTDGFEFDLGWTSDPGTTTRGAWVREDPIGVTGDQNEPTNPEDDTSDPGSICWVTGNGNLQGPNNEDNNDVDGGAATLISPAFGRLNMLSLDLSYDRWYYDNSGGGDFFKAELSSDGGQNWITAEHIVTSTGGWGRQSVDVFALMTPTDDMRLRFVVSDGLDDTTVEGAVDEILIGGTWVNCQAFTPSSMLAPNSLGDTLRVASSPSGHALLTWQPPPVDGGHDAATLYRVERALAPGGPFAEIGSATSATWVDVDALNAGASFYYRVVPENSGAPRCPDELRSG